LKNYFNMHQELTFFQSWKNSNHQFYLVWKEYARIGYTGHKISQSVNDV
jgi:hypothetical protein